jgi:hypothetical protein
MRHDDTLLGGVTSIPKICANMERTLKDGKAMLCGARPGRRGRFSELKEQT